MRFKDQGCARHRRPAAASAARSPLGFAAEGAHVAVADIDLETAERTVEDIRKQNGSAHAFALDVIDPKAVARISRRRRAPARTYRRAGQQRRRARDQSGARAPAGGMATASSTSTSPDVFLCSQAFGRHLVQAGKPGAIVNLASTLGVVAAPNRAAYTASKHAVVGLTKEMAMELGDKGIRVNAVGPGVIRTPLTERYFQDADYAQRIPRPPRPWALGRAARDRQSHPVPRVRRGELRHRHDVADRRRLDGRQAAVAGNAPRAASEA